MKKKYQKPSIKVKEIDGENLMQASLGTNTDITKQNDGETPPPEAHSKHGVFGFEDKYSVPSSIWDE